MATNVKNNDDIDDHKQLTNDNNRTIDPKQENRKTFTHLLLKSCFKTTTTKTGTCVGCVQTLDAVLFSFTLLV